MKAPEACLKTTIADAHHRLNPFLQVAPAPIGTADQNLWVARVLEPVDAVVLREATDDFPATSGPWRPASGPRLRGSGAAGVPRRAPVRRQQGHPGIDLALETAYPSAEELSRLD